MAADAVVTQSRARFGLGIWLIRAAVALVFISSGLEKFGIGRTGMGPDFRQDWSGRLVPIFHRGA